MLQVRQYLFETNSSALHSFILPNDSNEIKIPKSIKLYGDIDPTTLEGRIRYMYEIADEHGYGDDFKIYLESKGITIEDAYVPEPEPSLFSSMGITEQELETILFNPNIVSCDDTTNYNKVKKTENYKCITIRG